MRDPRYDDWRAAYAEDRHRGESTSTRGMYFPTWHQGKNLWPKRDASAAKLLDKNGPEHETLRSHLGGR